MLVFWCVLFIADRCNLFVGCCLLSDVGCLLVLSVAAIGRCFFCF